MIRLVAFVATLTLLLVGCSSQQTIEQPAFEIPRSILIMPVVNQSLNVDAPTYMFSTLAVPLAEKGYYVFPLNTTKVILEREGLYEPEMAWEVPPENLAATFGADAILYVTINRWDAQYLILTTTVTVECHYRLVNRLGEELWRATRSEHYSPDNDNVKGDPVGNLIGAMLSAAITRATPDYMPLAQQANTNAFYNGANRLPDGPYHRDNLPATTDAIPSIP